MVNYYICPTCLEDGIAVRLEFSYRMMWSICPRCDQALTEELLYYMGYPGGCAQKA